MQSGREDSKKSKQAKEILLQLSQFSRTKIMFMGAFFVVATMGDWVSKILRFERVKME